MKLQELNVNKTKKSLPKGTRKATSEKTLCVHSNSKKYKSQVLLNFKKEGKTMAKDKLTDEQVETEIKRLNSSPYVKLAQKEIRLKYKRRLHLYNLRSLEKRGKQLAEEGATLESLESQIEELDETELNETGI